ncbi:hypothetical protein [Streptomyces sp. NPDC091219]|uniref:hypothetical protein n=1 Tax=Streptomyces sp. NPDC091219 TaxID=3155193 RepID=UPI00344DBB56
MIANSRRSSLNRPDHKIVDRAKIREGQVPNWPTSLTIAVTAEGALRWLSLAD